MVKELKKNNMPDTKLKDLRSNDKNVDLDKAADMPVKRSGFGPRTSFGGSKNPELTKNSPTGYKPFKMLGHELPGIKQRGMPMKSFDASGGAINEEMVDKVSTTPGKYGSAVGGESPMKLWGAIKKAKDKLLSRGKAVVGAIAGKNEAPAEGGGDGGAVPPHGDEAHTGGAIGGGAEAGAEGGGDIFNVGDAIAGMEGLDAQGKKEYMGQFDPEQIKRIRMQQFKDKTAERRNSGPFGGMVGGSMWSDVRLKENIKRTGKSPSGIPIYEFNYIGDNARYSGAMAQDLLGTNSVSMHESGFYMVDYNNIDVDMKLL